MLGPFFRKMTGLLVSLPSALNRFKLGPKSSWKCVRDTHALWQELVLADWICLVVNDSLWNFYRAGILEENRKTETPFLQGTTAKVDTFINKEEIAFPLCPGVFADQQKWACGLLVIRGSWWRKGLNSRFCCICFSSGPRSKMRVSLSTSERDFSIESCWHRETHLHHADQTVMEISCSNGSWTP